MKNLSNLSLLFAISAQSTLAFTTNALAPPTKSFRTWNVNLKMSENPLSTPRNAEAGGEASSLVPDLPAAAGPSDTVANNEEGDAYDGTGGLGLAKGTTNTYVLPGMDQMTGEEYRAALQKSVIERQSRRKAGQVVGNANSNNYLDSL